VLSIGLVALSIVMEARKGETEVGSLTHLEDELDPEGEGEARDEAGGSSEAGEASRPDGD
jgi:hypothetical protein